MDEGWIKIHRKIKSHWVYGEKPFDKFHAWHDLLLSANHEQKTFLLGNTLITVGQGQFATSVRKLGERWGWSRHKVSDFLKLLSGDGMIEVIGDTNKTLITVVNWGLYQSDENEKGHERDTIGDTKGTQKDTNKNIYTDNTNVLSSSQPSVSDGEPKKKKSVSVLPHDSDAYKCAKYMDKQICKNIPSKKAADERTLQRWAADIDKINRIDEQSWDDISDALKFSQTDSFWRTNIMSGQKFREKFFTLLLKARPNDV